MTELNLVDTDPKLLAEAMELVMTQYMGTLRMRRVPVAPPGAPTAANKSKLRVR